MKSIIFLIAILGTASFTFAQIKVNPPSKNLRIEKIIQSIDGEGIIVQNITTNQKAETNQLAQFKDSLLFTGMKNGMLLSTGSVRKINTANLSTGMTGSISGEAANSYLWATASPQPELNSIAYDSEPLIPYTKDPITIPKLSLDTLANPVPSSITYPVATTYSAANNFQSYPFGSVEYADTDLQGELNGTYTLYDACVVELDIIPLGDTLSFRYMFASEEYDEYVGTQFNDAFAFFISGPGIDGTKNLAVLESGSRVSVNSINNGNPGNASLKPSNPSFYNRNTGQIPLEFDGFTRTLEVVEAVTAFETYHLKVIIADAGDGALDSGVFIEDGSVISYDYKYSIPFETDISDLDEKARTILLSMMQVANDHPEYVLQITGHTDSDGSEASNLILSQERINSTIDFIEEEGFSKDDIQTINKGESMPLTTNETEEGKKQNRRVEIKLIPSERQTDLELVSHVELTNFPNPARTSSTIEVRSDKDYDGALIKVYSTNGEFIGEQLIEYSKAIFDTSDWNAGIYFYSLLSEGKSVASSRLVVVN